MRPLAPIHCQACLDEPPCPAILAPCGPACPFAPCFCPADAVAGLLCLSGFLAACCTGFIVERRQGDICRLSTLLFWLAPGCCVPLPTCENVGNVCRPRFCQIWAIVCAHRLKQHALRPYAPVLGLRSKNTDLEPAALTFCTTFPLFKYSELKFGCKFLSFFDFLFTFLLFCVFCVSGTWLPGIACVSERRRSNRRN
jgi:hypothetical protein